MKIEVWESYCTTLSLWQVAQKDVNSQLTEMYVTKVVYNFPSAFLTCKGKRAGSTSLSPSSI